MKTHIQNLFIVLALFSGIHQTAAQQQLPDACWSGTWIGTYSFPIPCGFTDTGVITLDLQVINGIVVHAYTTEYDIICYGTKDDPCGFISKDGIEYGDLTGTVDGVSITLSGSQVNTCNGKSYDIWIGATLNACTNGCTIISYPWELPTFFTFTKQDSCDSCFADISVVADPEDGGTVDGGGSYQIGSQQEISAAANDDWMFIGWTRGNTDNPRTITVPDGGATYTAHFSQGIGYDPISWQLLPNGDVILSLKVMPLKSYAVSGATNLLPPINWVSLFTNTAGANGVVLFTNRPDPTKPNFWRIRQVAVNIFRDTFDPQTATGIGSYHGGDATNFSVGVVSGVGTNGSAALQIKSSFNNGPNGWGNLAGQWQDVTVSGNIDTNLSDYVLSFDAYVTGDASHQSGGGFMLMIQESAGTNWAPTFPQGTLQTYQPYQGGSDLMLPQSGIWKHFNINLGGSTFQGANGFNNNFNPTGRTWQISFQMNAGDWGSEPQTDSTLIIDNIVLTDFTPP